MLVTFRLCGHLQRLPVSTVFPLLWIPWAVMQFCVCKITGANLCRNSLTAAPGSFVPLAGNNRLTKLQHWCLLYRLQTSGKSQLPVSFQLCLIIITLGAPHPLTYPSFLTHEILSICIPKLQLTSYYHGKLRLKFVQRFAADTHFLFFLLIRFSLQSLAQLTEACQTW